MYMQKPPIIVIASGDHAGIGPEITLKMLEKERCGFIPIILGDKTQLLREAELYAPSRQGTWRELPSDLEKIADWVLDPACVYLYDVPLGEGFAMGRPTLEGGRQSLAQMHLTAEFCKRGLAEGLIYAPVTKKSLNLAAPDIDSDLTFYANEYGLDNVRPVVVSDKLMRCAVVSHVRFRDIINHITVDNVVDAGLDLLAVMRAFGQGDATVAMAALNVHGGDGGVFGDEESTVLQPAIQRLRAKGMQVEGPFPADTVFPRALSGKYYAVIFMHHDQGNIAGKLAQFNDSVVVDSKLPVPNSTPAHGSAIDIGGKGLASSHNMERCLQVVVKMALNLRNK